MRFLNNQDFFLCFELMGICDFAVFVKKSSIAVIMIGFSSFCIVIGGGYVLNSGACASVILCYYLCCQRNFPFLLS